MDEFIKKRQIINVIFKSFIVITIAFMLIAPLFGQWFREKSVLYTNISTGLVLITIVLTFFFSRYKKASKYVDKVLLEINDCGSYRSNIATSDLKSYETLVYNNLGEDFFTIQSDVKLTVRDFDFLATKKKESLYFAKCKHLTKEDYFEFSDAVNQSVAASNVKQKQVVVMLLAVDTIEDAVISYTKMTTQLGKSIVLPLVVNVSDGHVYFLNDKTNRFAFATKNALGYPNGVSEEQYCLDRKLPFQEKLERRMNTFNIRDFKDGKFNPHAD